MCQIEYISIGNICFPTEVDSEGISFNMKEPSFPTGRLNDHLVYMVDYRFILTPNSVAQSIPPKHVVWTSFNIKIPKHVYLPTLFLMVAILTCLHFHR